MSTCAECGMSVHYEPPTGKFVGGWIGTDGWGILCSSQTYGEPAQDHMPASFRADTIAPTESAAQYAARQASAR